MQKREYSFLLLSFMVWRVLTFLPVYLAKLFFELQNNFLGGGIQSYLQNTYLWSFANFDGEHYLSIAKMGYANGEQAFFPLYPVLIKLLGGSVTASLIISNVAFIVALLGLYKLVRLDYSEQVAKLATVLLLIFPTSFYFGAAYTESLFLMSIVWSFYFLRKDEFLLSAIFGAFASASRVVGLAILPVQFLYLYLKKKVSLKNILTVLISATGFVSYAVYSFFRWNDPLKFFNVASGFGEQRSDHLILLPQVFYRYFVKIIPNLTWSYFPVVFTTLLEISVALLFLYLIIISFKKISYDYWLFLVVGYLIPTLSGSFSSLPRYVVVLFPAFIYIAFKLEKTNKYLKFGFYVVLAILAVVTQMLFVRGYFVS